MIKAAIFDMDGLLIDSEPFWRRAHVEALAEHGVTIVEDDVRKMAGQRTDEVVRHWRETHNLTHIPNETLEASVVKRVMESITLEGRELPGVRALILLFKNHAIPMAVASSSAPEVIETVLTKLGLKDEYAIYLLGQTRAIWQATPGCFS